MRSDEQKIKDSNKNHIVTFTVEILHVEGIQKFVQENVPYIHTRTHVMIQYIRFASVC